MDKFLKITATALIALVLISTCFGVFNMAVGNWFRHASFTTIGLLFVGVFALFFFGYSSIRSIWKSSLIIISVLLLQACNYAKSNQQVVISTDCGMTWSKINIGDAVPVATGNRCFMKVVIPNFPMQGDSRFVSNFKDKVRANIHIDYDYSITDPLAFIRQAKYLGRANANVDDSEALDPAAFETAENSVIDKRIREVVKGLLIKEDIVEADQADLENEILNQSNKMLEQLGVKLNFITLTFDLDNQTRQAIDVATAMKIYQTKKLDDVGKSVISARAGATQITVENKTVPVEKQE
ncbi:SPFH domain-containing protein [Desertivirga xinjiangensis]|uniref:SPFH domain-containing protein n=1 Tax=Desertivirga xinjiangensis TaxID=539206 RepID=UPI00210F16DE|nr:SPFH domain-containing protein [Pedobacter xinjiangensis]